ncbi:hypothetical protein LTS10_006253 [Elasticomyces elasticus]|nr:hypothetical protein LTS10_006253 [Elasticomyces elasticus]
MATQTNVQEGPHETAVSKVFRIPELLEMILLQIATTPIDPPMHFDDRMQARRIRLMALLACECVDKRFHGTIQRSLPLQRALYCVAHKSGRLAPANINPLIHNQKYQIGDGGEMSVWWEDKAEGISQTLVFHHDPELLANKLQRRSLVRDGKWQGSLLTLVPERVPVVYVSEWRRGLHYLNPGATLADAMEGYEEWSQRPRHVVDERMS